MIVDSSALIAVVMGEPEAETFLGILTGSSEAILVSAVSLVESSIVVECRQGADATRDLELLVQGLRAEVVSVDSAQASAAFAAWKRFGKGRHPAALNLGDCFSYALAKVRGQSLLFKGDDFSQTDLVVALP